MQPNVILLISWSFFLYFTSFSPSFEIDISSRLCFPSPTSIKNKVLPLMTSFSHSIAPPPKLISLYAWILPPPYSPPSPLFEFHLLMSYQCCSESTLSIPPPTLFPFTPLQQEHFLGTWKSACLIMPGGKATCTAMCCLHRQVMHPKSFTICIAGNSDLEGNQNGIFTDSTDISTTLSDQAQCQPAQVFSAAVPPSYHSNGTTFLHCHPTSYRRILPSIVANNSAASRVLFGKRADIVNIPVNHQPLLLTLATAIVDFDLFPSEMLWKGWNGFCLLFSGASLWSHLRSQMYIQHWD